MEDNTLLKENLIKMVQKASKNSCVNEKIPISGEMYVSPKTRTKKKENNTIKKGITYMMACAAVSTVLIGGAQITGTMDFATEVREEVNDTYIKQNLTGGQYVKQSEHDLGFREYINDLNDFQLSDLYNETAEEMEHKDIEDVVDQMEENYLEGSSRNK